MSVGIKQTPTFQLKAISHEEMYNAYCLGKYKNISSVHNNSTQMISDDMETREHDPYTVNVIKNRSNHNITVMMTNGVQVKNYDGTSLKPGGICNYTLEKITGIPVGIPVDYPTRDPLTGKMTYYVVGEFVSFECAFAYLQQYCDTRGGKFKNSIVLLKRLFKQLYPKDDLKPAGPQRLHKNHGGTMEPAEFHKSAHLFIESENIMIQPAQIQFMQK